MEQRSKAWVSAILLAVTLAVNAMGAIGWINGLSQKEVSDRYPTLITPGPGTFSIWGVIYTLLILSVIVMLVKGKDPYYRKATNEISALFWLSCLLNMAWIISFSFLQIGLSALLIFGFLITLSLILQKLKKVQEKKRWLLPLTFGLYAGWLFIATVVNAAALLVKQNWNRFGLGEEVWAVTILAVAVVLVFLVQARNGNAVFPLPVAWAYFGIYQFLRSPDGYQGEYMVLQIVSLAGMAALIGLAAIRFYQNRYALLANR